MMCSLIAYKEGVLTRDVYVGMDRIDSNFLSAHRIIIRSIFPGGWFRFSFIVFSHNMRTITPMLKLCMSSLSKGHLTPELILSLIPPNEVCGVFYLINEAELEAIFGRGILEGEYNEHSNMIHEFKLYIYKFTEYNIA